MAEPPFRVVLLDAACDRTGFASGSPALDRYLHEQAGQDMRRRAAMCFVALASDSRIAGFYTLAAASVPLVNFPVAVQRKLPRYPTMPAARLGRLAVDAAHQGKGLGGALLADALERTTRADIATVAMVVDAKDERAAAFYAHHGFLNFEDNPLMLFLPLTTRR